MIDPEVVDTVRVGLLPESDFGLTDKIPHEIGTDLFQGTVQKLADTIGDYLGTSSGLAFNPTTVSDGETLPATTSNEWMLLGKGTFHNVGGGGDIVTTEELNAVTSNGLYWSLSVEIPVNVELAGITQNIRNGYTETTPSEDAVFKALALKANLADIPEVPNILLEQLDFEANGTDDFIDIGTTQRAKSFFYGSVLQEKSMWNQVGSVVTFTFVPEAATPGTNNLQFI